MLKLVLRGIRANLGRLFMTLISVVLGVACVSGSFILADSLREGGSKTRSGIELDRWLASHAATLTVKAERESIRRLASSRA